MAAMMKEELSTFDILALVVELQSVKGGYIDKIFHWDNNNFLFRFNVPGTGKKEIVLSEVRWIYLAGERPELPDTPTQLAMMMRRHLSGGRVTSIFQRDFDRIIVIEIQKEKKYRLIFELFRDGNLIIADEEKILIALYSRRWKHREIRPGIDYKFPPERFNPLEADFDKFVKLMVASKSDAVRTLATMINLGGQYAEEVCTRAGIDKSAKPSSMNEDELKRIYGQMRELIDAVRLQPDPVVIYDGEAPVDVTPIRLLIYSNLKTERHESFSLALDRFLKTKKDISSPAIDGEFQRLERQLDQQRQSVLELEKKANEFIQKAEMLYMNYQYVNNVLSLLKEKSSKMKWDEISTFARSLPNVKSIDPATHTIEINVDEIAVKLDYLKTLEENANYMYQEAKKMRDKIEGAKVALAETEKLIAERKSKTGELAAEKKKRKTKDFWFERYKWFFTSEGKLVIAGRDARTNEQLVKKHMTPADRYVHADIHGAPSVVIKEGAHATDDEMREAGIFAVSHSKAWKAGVGEGSAYWVLPDQVSKTPEAGEFVPRGAFIIRGKRNYMQHLPVELAVGEIIYEGERKVMCAPRTAMEKQAERFVVIAPGSISRDRFSAAMSDILEVPEEEVSRILPPGNISIVERKNLEIDI